MSRSSRRRQSQFVCPLHRIMQMPCPKCREVHQRAEMRATLIPMPVDLGMAYPDEDPDYVLN